MKLFINNGVSKKILISILLVMMLFNSIIPNFSQASFGGKLFKPIAKLIAGIADVVIKILQNMFLGYDDIEVNSSYYIAYSPGIIFSNKVPALNVNFFNVPREPYTYSGKLEKYSLITSNKVTDTTKNYNDIKIQNLIDATISNAYSNADNVIDISYSDAVDIWYNLSTWEIIKRFAATTDSGTLDNYSKCYKIVDNDGSYVYAFIFEQSKAKGLGNIFNAIKGKSLEYTHYCYIVTDYVEVQGDESRQYSSTALQETIATWYIALRAIALVGLLSVLVYIGIRILISSTGQEKAKYKNMITNWLVAICLLFVLQYIMVFIINITEQVTDMLSSKVIDTETSTDSLMTGVRQAIGDNEGDKDLFAYTLMYVVLVIYTCVFTIHYLKRLVYLAFFTMIAPLICLTYPLDKIKDGQAQAFSMWLREYIFNVLIQPVHLLLYYIFITSATELVSENPLYAVICIGFLIPAEKFFRKMFGFDKANSVSQLGAAAGGALVMNAINKMGHRSEKQAAGKVEGGEGSKPVRMASSNGIKLGSGSGGTNSSGGNNPGGGTSSSGGSNPAGGTNSSGGNNSARGTNSSSGSNPARGTSSSSGTPGSFGTPATTANIHGPTLPKAIKASFKNKESFKNGASAVRREFVNRNTLKKAGRMARRGIIGAAGAATAGTIGLAAGVATGDLGNALKYGAGGAAAGYMGANYAGDKMLAGEKHVRETFKEGVIGQDEYNNLKADKEFYDSKEFRSMINDKELKFKNENGDELKDKERTESMKNAVQTYRNSGITDTSKIKTAMKSGLSPEQGAYAIKLADQIGKSGYNNPKTREDFIKRYKNNMPAGANTEKIWKTMETLLS